MLRRARCSLQMDLADEIARLGRAIDFPALPRPFGPPLGTAVLRAEPDDFSVIEERGAGFAGQGEHWYVKLRKQGHNTRWVARQLAEFAQLPYKQVSYAGLKDRHAVAEQWFSLHLAGRESPDWAAFSLSGVEVLKVRRHDRKLRQGYLSFNQFNLVLRELQLRSAVDATELEARLEQISGAGVPNYFGPQRFGHSGGNLALVLRPGGWRRLPRDLRGFALSALRGALFNLYLAERVTRGDWNDSLEGEARQTDRARGAAEGDTRVFAPEISAAGPLWGRGRAGSSGAVAALEDTVFGAYPAVTALLEEAGARFARRALRARVGALHWQRSEGVLRLQFALGAGAFATAALHPLLEVRDAAIVENRFEDA